jgi:hypothetical protein
VLSILGIAFLAGFFLDWLEISLIMLPLVAPVVVALGFDEIWFIVLFAVTLQTSFLTPPVGFSLFYLKGVAPPEVSHHRHLQGHHPLRAPADSRGPDGLHLPADRSVAALAHALGRRAARRCATVLAGLLALPGLAQAGDMQVLLGPAYAIANDSIGQLPRPMAVELRHGVPVLRSARRRSARSSARPCAGVPPLAPARDTRKCLDAPAPDDRPFGAAFAFEVLTHGRLGRTETSLGAGLAVTGPQTVPSSSSAGCTSVWAIRFPGPTGARSQMPSIRF